MNWKPRKEALAAVKKLILDLYAPRPSRVAVEFYCQKGLRVSEVTMMWDKPGAGISGLSFMRSGGGAAILAVEDFLVTYGTKPYRPLGWESDIDVHDDARCLVISEFNPQQKGNQ